jgi:phosphatidylserine/phosphatidylglycerophosphate/cardiolipin synthase-like enzyme
MFSPEGGVAQSVIDLVKGASGELLVASYSVTNSDIVDAWIACAQAGNKVTVLMDESETHGVQATLHDKAVAGGCDVLLVKPPKGIQHNKFTVTGNLLETGSYNYTEAAEHNNWENALFINDEATAQAYREYFWKIAATGYRESEMGQLQVTVNRTIRHAKAGFRNRGY